jgi:haloalkane dehalogenase
MENQLSTEVFRTPDERPAHLPGNGYRPNYAHFDGLRLHYGDFGPPTGKPVVCVYGKPGWAYLYRNMIRPLAAAGCRVIVPDYAGFRRSDKPTDRRWYTFDSHCGLVDRIPAGQNLTAATVIVRTFGDPIDLRWAVSHANQFGALLILNTFLRDGSDTFLEEGRNTLLANGAVTENFWIRNDIPSRPSRFPCAA